MTLTEEILSQLPGDVLGSLRRVDNILASIRKGNAPGSTVVKESQQQLGTVDFDVVICGGTLGILIGTALILQGWRVALIERGTLRGREQEWNISRNELQTFVDLNLLSPEELEKAIATQYNPARVGFKDGVEVWVKDVLNIGVDPVYLLATLKDKFLQAGGELLENTAFSEVTVHPDGVAVNVGDGLKDGLEGQLVKAQLLIDAMGHLSPITKQARNGQKPDALCLVVGSCAEYVPKDFSSDFTTNFPTDVPTDFPTDSPADFPADFPADSPADVPTDFPKSTTGDLLLSFTELENQCQYFWEAFPARDGRTTYLFTYMDAEPQRLTLETLFEEYLRLLPEYQEVELQQIKFKRALFGFFPTYRQSPLKTPWNRILPVGDSSGNQSPLSFGGFGAMVRHLKRLTFGIDEALKAKQISANALSWLQPYQPSLTVTWLFQKAMSVGVNQNINSNQINQLLSAVFKAMQELGEPVLKPFLQDIVKFTALTQTLLKTGLSYPMIVIKVIPQVGLGSLLDWMVHYVNLGIYTFLFSQTKMLNKILEPWIKNMSDSSQYYIHRLIDAWKYGSGSDY